MQRNWLYLIFTFYFTGAWFSALAIYSKITFSNISSYISSFSILLMSIIPGIMFANQIGWLLSFFKPINVIILGLVVSIISVLLMTQTTNTILLLLLVLLQACAHKTIAPVKSIVIRNNFNKNELTIANARMVRIQSFSTILSPPLASAAVLMVGVNGTLVIDAALGVVALVASILLHKLFKPIKDQRKKQLKVKETVISEIKNYWKVLLIPATAIFLVIVFDIIYPVYIRDTKTGGLFEFSTILSAFSAGSFLSSWFANGITYLRIYPVLLSSTLIGLVLPTHFFGYYFILLAIAFLAGVSHIQLVVYTNTRLQSLNSFTHNTAVAFEFSLNTGQLSAVLFCMFAFIFKTKMGYSFVVFMMLITSITLIYTVFIVTSKKELFFEN